MDADEAKARELIARLELDDTRYERDAAGRLRRSERPGCRYRHAGPLPRRPDRDGRAGWQAGVHREAAVAHDLQEADRAIEAVADGRHASCRSAFSAASIGASRGAPRPLTMARSAPVHLLRSITRDPAVPRPEGPLPWAIFLETMIHDFDVLRWLAASEPVEVSAMAGSLAWGEQIQPAGFVDTAVCTVRFANGALGTADVSFNGAFGYDVRAEVFGTGGMMASATAARTTPRCTRQRASAAPTAPGSSRCSARRTPAELAHFVECARTGTDRRRDGQGRPRVASDGAGRHRVDENGAKRRHRRLTRG